MSDGTEDLEKASAALLAGVEKAVTALGLEPVAPHPLDAPAEEAPSPEVGPTPIVEAEAPSAVADPIPATEFVPMGEPTTGSVESVVQQVARDWGTMAHIPEHAAEHVFPPHVSESLRTSPVLEGIRSAPAEDHNSPSVPGFSAAGPDGSPAPVVPQE